MKKIIISLLFLIMTSPFVFSLEPGTYSYVTYWSYSGNTVNVEWDITNGADEYEINVIHLETEQMISIGRTHNTHLSFQDRKSVV